MPIYMYVLRVRLMQSQEDECILVAVLAFYSLCKLIKRFEFILQGIELFEKKLTGPAGLSHYPNGCTTMQMLYHHLKQEMDGWELGIETEPFEQF